MSTRGAVGFRINGQFHVAYNHHDSYPTGLGKGLTNLISFLKIKDWESLRKSLSNLVVIYDEKEIDPVSNIKDILKGKIKTFWAIDPGFLMGDISCEWAYIINLDDMLFEVWKGYQKFPQKGNPLGCTLRKRTELYPCARVLVASLKSIPEDWSDSLVEEILPYKNTPRCVSFEDNLKDFLSVIVNRVDECIESKNLADLKKIRNSLRKFLKNLAD